MERPEFADGQIYHVFNRGVEKRTIFLNEKDYFRFVHDMYEFNDENPALNLGFRFDSYGKSLVKSDFTRFRKPRKPLVEILCFCLMPNHYHFILLQLIEGGITEFMRKMGTGYTNYFNTKYKRVGPLFQGKFKAVLIEKESHFLYLPHYIHLNPLDLNVPSWRDKKIENIQKSLKFLGSYRWSSYPDHIGKKNFPSVISTNLFKKFYGTPKEYRESLREWIQDMDINDLSNIIIEDPYEV